MSVSTLSLNSPASARSSFSTVSPASLSNSPAVSPIVSPAAPAVSAISTVSPGSGMPSHRSFFRANKNYKIRHPNSNNKNNNNNNNNGNGRMNMRKLASNTMDDVTEMIQKEAKGDVGAMKRLFADFKPAMIAEVEGAKNVLNERTRTRRNHRKSRRNHRKSRRS